MQYFGGPNIYYLKEEIRSDVLLQVMIWYDSPPYVSSHCDFISRRTGVPAHLSEFCPAGRYSRENKAKKKPKKGEMLIYCSRTENFYLEDR